MLQSHETIMDELEYFGLYLTKRFGNPIDSGRNRTVWKTNNNNVIKVPRCGDGITDNEWECAVSDDSLGFEILGKTKMLIVNDIPIVVMEYLTPANIEEINNYIGNDYNWTLSIDCGQVGFDCNGKLKAYDYGIR